MSLTRTLTLLVTTTVLFIALIAAVWSYFESNHELEELFDAELAQSSRIVQGLVQHLAPTQSLADLSVTLAKTLQLPVTENALNGVFDEALYGAAGHKYEKKLGFEVWSDQGQPLLNTLKADDGTGLTPGYAWAESGGFQWRTFTLQDPETGFWIRTAQREDIRQELSQELALGNTLPLLVALPLLVLASVMAIQIGFRPLRRVERPIRGMAPERIHPLDTHKAPREVAGFVQAVNGLLQRLDQALERERRFSSDAAHELRTPLTALRLNLEKLSEQHPDSFADLTQSVDRMVHLVEQMLLLSRIESGRGFEKQTTDLSELVAQSIADIAPLALRKEIEPSLENLHGSIYIHCQPELITSMMRSLLANALQYSPGGTSITARLDTTGDKAIIRLCDQGPGIPESDRDKALSRFTRLDQRIGSGAGLGLAIAQRIAERHNGRLSLSGRSDGGEGLCVVVELPLAPA
jgi:two-component system sensor histidine kinase QseC